MYNDVHSGRFIWGNQNIRLNIAEELKLFFLMKNKHFTHFNVYCYDFLECSEIFLDIHDFLNSANVRDSSWVDMYLHL